MQYVAVKNDIRSPVLPQRGDVGSLEKSTTNFGAMVIEAEKLELIVATTSYEVLQI